MSLHKLIMGVREKYIPLPGGPTDKFGNRYEGRWTVSCMIEEMREHADSIRLEPPGEDAQSFGFAEGRNMKIIRSSDNRVVPGIGHSVI
jgi:hypothetical protein